MGGRSLRHPERGHIAGFQRLIKRGEFDEPEDCVRARKEWLVRSNVLLIFVEEHCVKGADQKQKITEFYKNFCEFCEDEGVRRNVMTLQGVKTRLETMGYDIGVLDGNRVVRGLRSIGWGEADTTGEPTEADEVDDSFPV